MSSVSAMQSTRHRNIEAFSLEQGNAERYYIDKFEVRKRQCVQCKRVGTKTPKRHPVESNFECVQCSIALCKGACFADYHGAN